MRRLLVGLPLEWRPRHRRLSRKDAIPLTDRNGKKIWVLAQPLPDAHFGQPIAEDYGSEFRYFGMYDRSDELDLDRTIGFVESVIIAEETSADDETTDIRHIERRTDLDGTEKETLIQARRGQGRFRKQLEKLWGCCPISGHDRRELLRASHILPWRSADDAQRLDRYNGILLSANLDALFDKHLITFAEDGRLMVSDELSAEELCELGLTKPVTVDFSAAHKAYLRYHRSRFEKRRARRRGGRSDGG
ncbi:HNH endonuclease [Bradyrhizobium sp. BRP22]|uniref:HNH endonuclease n=1 Tax=Bradyrhizobium sp. BRP22 TaxID=2793821 RepID=UPI001CD24811|nr:HNH endonuclease [Bradyrhizobium sp. BRP22]